MRLNKKVVKAGLKQLGKFVNSNSPVILTGMGLAGMVTTVVFGIKATPKAEKIIKCEESQLERPLTNVEIVKHTWKCYIPTVAMGAASAACIIGGQSVSLRRNAALAGLYAFTDNTLKEYQDKVIETVGEKKNTDILDGMAKDIVDKNPVNELNVIRAGGDHLCYDPLTGRYFRSDIELINRAVNNLNKCLIDDRYETLNDFYYMLGLPEVDSTVGDNLGWNTDKLLDLGFSSQLASNGEPCIVLRYDVAPKFEYQY